MTHIELKAVLDTIATKAPALTTKIANVQMFITPRATNLFAQTQVKSIITAAAIEVTTGRMDRAVYTEVAEALANFTGVTWVDATPQKVADPVADLVKMTLDATGLKRF